MSKSLIIPIKTTNNKKNNNFYDLFGEDLSDGGHFDRLMIEEQSADECANVMPQY